MALGVVPVASNVGALSELIQDGENGSLYSLQHEESATEKIVTLLRDRQQLQLMADKAKKTAARFDEQGMVSRYETHFAGLST